MKKETRMYQLMDEDNTYCGMIETDALEGDVETMWGRVLKRELSDTEYNELINRGVEDETYMKQLLNILEWKNYIAEEVEAIEIYP